jgi:AAA domain
LANRPDGLPIRPTRLDLAARLSSGRELPDGFRPAQPGAVLLISGEDGVRDTIVPRLLAAEADMRRVHVFHGRGRNGMRERLPTFPEDCDLLRDIIAETGAQLVIADPFLAFLSNHLCAVNNQMVCQTLTPLATIAEATRSAIALVRHLNKGGNGQRAIYRGSGSMAFIGAARTAFLAGRDPEEPELRLLACTKSNLSTPPATLGYRIERTPQGQPRIAWAGTVDVSADELVLAPRGRPGEALATAVNFLGELLRKGPASREEIFRKARGAAISDRTLIRAKQQLQVVSQQCWRKEENLYYWCLPEDAARYTPDNWDDSEHRRQLAMNRERDRLTEHLRQFDKPLRVASIQ